LIVRSQTSLEPRIGLFNIDFTGCYVLFSALPSVCSSEISLKEEIGGRQPKIGAAFGMCCCRMKQSHLLRGMDLSKVEKNLFKIVPIATLYVNQENIWLDK